MGTEAKKQTQRGQDYVWHTREVVQWEGLYQPPPFSHGQKNLNGSRLVCDGAVCSVMLATLGESCAVWCQRVSCNERGERPGDILTSSATITARCGPWACHRHDRLLSPTDAALFCWTGIEHKTIYRALSHFVSHSNVAEGLLLFQCACLCLSSKKKQKKPKTLV